MNEGINLSEVLEKFIIGKNYKIRIDETEGLLFIYFLSEYNWKEWGEKIVNAAEEFNNNPQVPNMKMGYEGLNPLCEDEPTIYFSIPVARFFGSQL